MPTPRINEDVLTLTNCVDQVRRFHLQIRAPIAAAGTSHTLPCDPASALIYSNRLLQLSKEMADAANGTTDVLLSRVAMTLEEIGEWLAANGQGDVTAAADALGDRLYLLLGDAVATGLPLANIFEAVHRSNLSKFPMVTTGLGKAVKGASYQPPDLASLLAECAKGRSRDDADDLNA